LHTVIRNRWSVNELKVLNRLKLKKHGTERGCEGMLNKWTVLNNYSAQREQK